MTIIWIALAFWVGSLFGVFIMALMNISSDADAHIRKMEDER